MNVEARRNAATVNRLALALVHASSVPVLLLDGELTVVAASDSFCSTFHVAPEHVPERQLAELGRGEWDTPQVRALLRSTMLGYARTGAYEMDLKRRDRDPRRLVLSADKLDTGDPLVVRILFSITDITRELAAESLRQKLTLEKVALQQGMQHRIANSLQIIASVLLQAGRDLRWRSQPGAAYPALAMANLERRLDGPGEDDIEIAAYLRQLCDSLEAALVEDPERVCLVVEADAGMRSAEDARVIGLIVTELVINALRHAFPERGGTIRVGYHRDADDWVLSVSDDGTGMRNHSRPGLGTGLVEALARQLGADGASVSSEAGTTVTLSRRLAQPTRIRRVATAAHRT